MRTQIPIVAYDRFPRARGTLGRIMSNTHPGTDMAAIMAAFETYQNEGRAMAGEIRQLGQAIDDIHATVAGLRINGGAGGGGGRKRNLAPFASFLRSGALDVHAGMTTSEDPAGGYLVPETVDSVIQNQLISLSPLRGYATIVTLGHGAGRYSFNVNRRGSSSGWVGEQTARPDTNTPALAQVTPAEGEIYANPKASQWLLDDSAFDVETFLQDNISDEFAVQEGVAFATGDGVLKPRGYMTYPAVLTTDPTRAFGTVQYLKTTNANGFAASNPADQIIALVYALRAPYRAGPGVAWMMNSTTASVVRQFKDGQGRYIWADSLQAGQPSMLLGYPVAIDENMPDIGPNQFPIAFGNWKLGYRIVDRLGTRILRDPYSDKPFVHFYTTKRVGGTLADSNAIKLLKCEA